MRDPIRLSPLGFGCAPIMGKVGKSQAMRAMELAFNLGVTHFDVARSYGFGRAEQVVGKFIKGRRDKVTVTSKFGIVPPVLSLRTKAIIPVARVVVSIFPQLKTRLKNKSGQLLAMRNFDAKYARQCLEQSLSELDTEYIDIYLIHEPDRAMLNNPDELRAFLEESVNAGKIRRWGFGFGTMVDIEWAGTIGGDIIQFEGNIFTLPLCNSILNDTRQRIVTRPFAGGGSGVNDLGLLVQEMDLLPILKELGATLGDVSLCLSRQLAGEDGSVLCSMFSPEHIQNNVRAINVLASDERMVRVIDKVRLSILNEC